MKKIGCFISAFIVLVCLPAAARAGGDRDMKFNAVYGRGGPVIATATGSPGELGLLKALAESFGRENPCRVGWLKMGSGEALRALEAGKVDMIMVHAPAAEKRAVEEGWACMRTLLGGNEFYIVGPKSDPAGIREAESAADAYAKIAKAKAKFFSRGDGSGTHKREMKIWDAAGIKPEGEWYIVTHAFMGRTLKLADKEEGYFMTDSSTYVVNRTAVKHLVVLFKGDPVLANVYHGLMACRNKGPQRELAEKFLTFTASDQGQQIFRDYGKNAYGVALYSDAEHARKWDR